MTSASVLEQKFSNLRRRLDQLGYRQPLGIESLPLVERLFLDLIHTTESLKKAKLSPGSHTQAERLSANAEVDAYRSDNAKLIKENNELHQELIHMKENSEFTIKELKSSLRKIEHEHADLKFLNNQYVHKMHSLEHESKQKSERIIQLQEKNFNAVVQTPGGRKKNIPFRRQRMEVDCAVAPAEIALPSTGLVTLAADPYVADLLKVADESVAQLQEELKTLQEEKAGFEAKISHLRMQVNLRDDEVDRLTRMLEGGRPFDVVALESRNRQNERTMSHLNIQVDYLQQKNCELQDQLNRLASKANSFAETDARNYELAKELKNVDLMAQKLEKEKDKVIHAADLEIFQTKVELEKLRTQVEEMDFEITQLKNERVQCKVEVETISKELNNEREKNDQLRSLVEKVQDDKQKLGQKISKLNISERDLVLEIDRLRHQYQDGLLYKQSKNSSEAVEQLIKGLEEEREYWKSEVDVLQQMLNSKSFQLTSSISDQLQPKSPVNQAASLSSVGDEILYSSSPFNFKLSDTRKSGDCEMNELRRERDDLQRMLNKFECHVAEIQANVRVVTLERDNLKTMMEEMKEEISRTRLDAVQSPNSTKATLAAQAMLRRVENERDEAILSCRNLTVERDSLKERLQIATDASVTERNKLEQTIEELESALSTAESNQKTAEEQLRLSQTHVDALENRLKESVSEAAAARNEASQCKATASQMRRLADETDESLKQLESHLARNDADRHVVYDRLRILSDQLNVLQQAKRDDLDEINKLRLTVAELDRTKDELQTIVDEKTEEEVKRREAITDKEQVINNLQKTVGELEMLLSNLKNNIASKEHEIVSLRRQLDYTSEELAEVGHSREVLLKENRRLQDDLTMMTQENQSLNQELEEMLQEKEHFKGQIQEYLMEVKRFEELLSAKERERTEILEQYQSLNHEVEQCETRTLHLESEVSGLRLEILSKDSDIRLMRDRLDKAEREIQEHFATKHVYEVQMSNMAKSVATLEETVRHLEEEKHHLIIDLAAVRELCAQLESNKENLQRQLMTKSLDHEKLQTLLDDVKHESELLRSQVTNERSTKQSLESLLQENRNKEWQIQLRVQEKEAEIQLLREQIQTNNSKIDCQAIELNQHRTRTIEVESDLERLKRQLISERFERERVVQELRRNGLSLPGGGSQLGAISPNSISQIKSSNQMSASEVQ